MENFLQNNVPFEDTDDAITFIINVKNDNRKYSILDYLDEPISKDELVNYLMQHVKPDVVLDESIIKDYVSGLDLETVSRVYYKNQLLELLSNGYFINQLSEIMEDTSNEEKINSLKDLVLDFVYYDFLYEERYKKAMKDTRHAVITIDTDSVFCNVNKHVLKIGELLSLQLDSSKKNDIVNIIIKITTGALGRIFWTLTTNMGVIERAKPIINMKQELTQWLLCIVIYIEHLSNCWNGN